MNPRYHGKNRTFASDRHEQAGGKMVEDRNGNAVMSVESDRRNDDRRDRKNESRVSIGADEIPTTLSDDSLLAQIDEFREKAAQLQSLINAKQHRAKELETILGEKEQKNKKLQAELDKRSKEASSLVSGVEEQVDRLLGELRVQLTGMEHNITDAVSGRVDGLKKDISDEVGDRVASAANNTDGLKETLRDVTKNIEDANDKLTKSLDEMKNEITESVHSENVKVYRNIQDLLKEDNKSEELEISLEVWYRVLKNRLSLTMTFMIINIGVGVLVLLAALGIFS